MPLECGPNLPDGLRAGGEASGARRGELRCPDITAKPRAGTDRARLYDDITDKIMADLEAGRVPWVQPWGTAAAKAPLAMPRNAATGRHYSGINVLLLWGAAVEYLVQVEARLPAMTDARGMPIGRRCWSPYTAPA